ncbi:MAG TPA: hypothetical protein PKB10_05275, partial [Tepidisphaeraceae bacterium]|nr:hypothetical protein [Tepidisphaeraceae bacterium]
RLADTLAERAILIDGIAIDADVTAIEGQTNARNVSRAMPVGVRLAYPNPTSSEGLVARPTTVLPPAPGQRVSVGDKIPLRLNPEDGADFRFVTDPPSLMQAIVPGAVLSGCAILPLGVALLRRSRVLRVWRDGEKIEASVQQVGTTPLAPRSKLLKVRTTDGQTIQLLWPNRLGAIEPGQSIDVMRHLDHKTLAVAADCYPRA